MQGVVMVAASVKNLSYTYRVTSTSFSSRVLENISFSVNEGGLQCKM
jgi:ABC-type oligopeptide transport system ATPase subunit